MHKQQPGMDEFDLQAEREAAALRQKNSMRPKRTRRYEDERPQRRPQPTLDRLLRR